MIMNSLSININRFSDESRERGWGGGESLRKREQFNIDFVFVSSFFLSHWFIVSSLFYLYMYTLSLSLLEHHRLLYSKSFDSHTHEIIAISQLALLDVLVN